MEGPCLKKFPGEQSENQKDDFSICNCVWVRENHVGFEHAKRGKATAFLIQRRTVYIGSLTEHRKGKAIS